MWVHGGTGYMCMFVCPGYNFRWPALTISALFSWHRFFHWTSPNNPQQSPCLCPPQLWVAAPEIMPDFHVALRIWTQVLPPLQQVLYLLRLPFPSPCLSLKLVFALDLSCKHLTYRFLCEFLIAFDFLYKKFHGVHVFVCSVWISEIAHYIQHHLKWQRKIGKGHVSEVIKSHRLKKKSILVRIWA